MVAAARRELASAGVTKPPDVVIADAGYWHLEQMNQITGDGIPVLIPPDSSRRARKPKRPGWDGGAYDFMRSVLSNELGGELLPAARPTHRADPSPTPNTTAASPGSPGAADQPLGPNGDWWPPPTTWSSSTSTSPPRSPDAAAPVHVKPAGWGRDRRHPLRDSLTRNERSTRRRSRGPRRGFSAKFCGFLRF